jgi:hypothetical protein
MGGGGWACAAGFEDAVGEVAATLEVKPGSEAGRQWVAGSAGSVRLVGSLQSLAETGAVVDFRVDGESIWSRKLGAGDTIRHGFDVAAYELKRGAKVDFRVVAGAEPARVAVSFQVVPEPFLSKWAAERPAGYPVWSESEKKELREKGQKVLATIREAAKTKRGTLVIPPGDYLFHAQWSQASTLSKLADLVIEADGVTFWFEPPLVHALLFEDCRNVTVRGLTIDFTLPCWFQARVSEVDREAKTIRASVMAGYAPRNSMGEAESSGSRAFMFYDADGRFINHQHSPGEWRMSEDDQSIVCEKIALAGSPSTLKAGDYVVGTLRTGAALRSNNCDGMRFESLNIWSSPGMAVNENGGAGGNQYLQVRATRRPLTNRLHAFGADIFHLAGTDRGPTLDRCEMAYGADDTLNIHGSFGRVVKARDERHFFLEGAYAVGDTIEFRDQRSVALLGVAKVLAVTALPDGPTLKISEKFTAMGNHLVELDKPLDLEPLSLVVMDGKRSAAGFILRNCWLHDDFQRTLINGSPGGLIENNTLQNLGHGISVMFETWGPWMEGPFARNLVIRNNRFLDLSPNGTAISVSMQPPGGGSGARRFQAMPVTNMTIEGNYFGRTSVPPLSIHNVDGLKIHSNSVNFPADLPAATGLANRAPFNWLYLQDCNEVFFSENLTPAAHRPRRTDLEGHLVPVTPPAAR